MLRVAGLGQHIRSRAANIRGERTPIGSFWRQRSLNNERKYGSTPSSRFVFGIDFGTRHTRVAVVDPGSKRPELVVNRKDNSSFWHNTIAIDTQTNKIVVGAEARKIEKIKPKNAVPRIKQLLGRSEVEVEQWKEDTLLSAPVRWHDNKIFVKLGGQEYDAVTLASHIFLSIKQAAEEYMIRKGITRSSLPPFEAYISVPFHFTEEQRDAILEAARLAGVSNPKLVDEPLAVMYNTLRIEPATGFHLVMDFGEEFSTYLVRSFRGRVDVLPDTYRKHVNFRKMIEDSYVDYLRKERKISSEAAADLMRDLNDVFIDHPDVVTSSGYTHTREERALATAVYSHKAFQAVVDEVIKSVRGYIQPQNITHLTLIGGGSLEYPEVARAIEIAFKTRLSDTVTQADLGIAYGTAIKAAEDAMFLKTILNGRDVDAKGRIVPVENPLHQTPQQGRYVGLMKDSALPLLAPAFSYENIAALTPVLPLYPPRKDGDREQVPLRPEVAISYANLKDPLSDKYERWARVSVRAPFKPGVPLVKPHLVVVFVLNLTANLLVRAGLDIPDHIQNLDELAAYWKMDVNKLITTDPNASPQLAEHEKEVKFKQLKQAYKDNAYHRTLNRARDMMSFIMRQLDRMHDSVGVCVVGPGSATHRVRRLEVLETAELDAIIDTVYKCDPTGRAAERMHEAVQMGYDLMMQHRTNPIDIELDEFGLPIDYEKKPGDEELSLEDELILQSLREKLEEDLDEEEEDGEEEDGEEEEGEGEEGEKEKKDEEDSLQLFKPKQTKKKEEEQKPRFMGEPTKEEEEAVLKEYLADVIELNKRIMMEKNIPLANETLPSEMDYPHPIPKIPDINLRRIGETPPPPAKFGQHEAVPIGDEHYGVDFEDFGFALYPENIAEKSTGWKPTDPLPIHDDRVEYRIVVIHDDQPAADTLPELESVLNTAANDNISTTFISIDGIDYEGKFIEMLGRIKNSKYLRMYRKNLFTNEFLQEWEGTNRIMPYLLNSPYKAVTVKLDFDGYTIDRIYGGPLQVKERERLERGSKASSLRFKLASVDTSYPTHLMDTETDWSLRPDPQSLLIKLVPKEREPSVSKALATYSDDFHPGAVSTPSLSPAPHVDNRSRVDISVSYLDEEDIKRDYQRSILLFDDTAPGYADENGIVTLVYLAKFAEMMRVIMHYPFQLALASGDQPRFPDMFKFPELSAGIPHIKAAQESQLLSFYDMRGNNSDVCSAIVQLATEKQRAGESLVMQKFRTPIEQFMAEYLALRLPEWRSYGYVEAAKYLRSDLVHSICQNLAHIYWKSIGTFGTASRVIVAGRRLASANMKALKEIKRLVRPGGIDPDVRIREQMQQIFEITLDSNKDKVPDDFPALPAPRLLELGRKNLDPPTMFEIIDVVNPRIATAMYPRALLPGLNKAPPEPIPWDDFKKTQLPQKPELYKGERAYYKTNMFRFMKYDKEFWNRVSEDMEFLERAKKEGLVDPKTEPPQIDFDPEPPEWDYPQIRNPAHEFKRPKFNEPDETGFNPTADPTTPVSAREDVYAIVDEKYLPYDKVDWEWLEKAPFGVDMFLIAPAGHPDDPYKIWAEMRKMWDTVVNWRIRPNLIKRDLDKFKMAYAMAHYFMRRSAGLPVDLQKDRIFLRGHDKKWIGKPDEIVGNPNWNVAPELISTDVLEEMYLSRARGVKMDKKVYLPGLPQALQAVELRRNWLLARKSQEALIDPAKLAGLMQLHNQPVDSPESDVRIVDHYAADLARPKPDDMTVSYDARASAPPVDYPVKKSKFTYQIEQDIVELEEKLKEHCIKAVRWVRRQTVKDAWTSGFRETIKAVKEYLWKISIWVALEHLSWRESVQRIPDIIAGASDFLSRTVWVSTVPNSLKEMKEMFKRDVKTVMDQKPLSHTTDEKEKSFKEMVWDTFRNQMNSDIHELRKNVPTDGPRLFSELHRISLVPPEMRGMRSTSSSRDVDLTGPRPEVDLNKYPEDVRLDSLAQRMWDNYNMIYELAARKGLFAASTHLVMSLLDPKTIGPYALTLGASQTAHTLVSALTSWVNAFYTYRFEEGAIGRWRRSKKEYKQLRKEMYERLAKSPTNPASKYLEMYTKIVPEPDDFEWVSPTQEELEQFEKQVTRLEFLENEIKEARKDIIRLFFPIYSRWEIRKRLRHEPEPEEDDPKHPDYEMLRKQRIIRGLPIAAAFDSILEEDRLGLTPPSRKELVKKIKELIKDRKDWKEIHSYWRAFDAKMQKVWSKTKSHVPPYTSLRPNIKQLKKWRRQFKNNPTRTIELELYIKLVWLPDMMGRYYRFLQKREKAKFKRFIDIIKNAKDEAAIMTRRMIKEKKEKPAETEQEVGQDQEFTESGHGH